MLDDERWRCRQMQTLYDHAGLFQSVRPLRALRRKARHSRRLRPHPSMSGRSSRVRPQLPGAVPGQPVLSLGLLHDSSVSRGRSADRPVQRTCRQGSNDYSCAPNGVPPKILSTYECLWRRAGPYSATVTTELSHDATIERRGTELCELPRYSLQRANPIAPTHFRAERRPSLMSLGSRQT